MTSCCYTGVRWSVMSATRGSFFETAAKTMQRKMPRVASWQGICLEDYCTEDDCSRRSTDVFILFSDIQDDPRAFRSLLMSRLFLSFNVSIFQHSIILSYCAPKAIIKLLDSGDRWVVYRCMSRTVPLGQIVTIFWLFSLLVYLYSFFCS